MALVIGRKVGETIHISPGITITVCRIKDHSVRLAIEADKSVSILRGELIYREVIVAPKDVDAYIRENV